jgi:hypothetical protein
VKRWRAVAIAAATIAACHRDLSQTRPGHVDSAFAAVQIRGKTVMGVDQYTSAHVFEEFPDGGRIVLDRDDAADSAGIAIVRTHMRDVAADFRAGNFSRPFAVHAQQVPGTRVMTARKSTISYEVVDRPRGAEVRMHTTDTSAVRAIHDFLAFQRFDHRAPGHEGMDPDEHAEHMRASAAAPTPTNCAPPASAVNKTGVVTHIRFANGDTLSLRDEPAGDGQIEYKSRGYAGAIQYHVFELLMWGGPSYWYEAYNACSGERLVIDNMPVVSPDSLRFVTIGYGVPITPLVKRIQVLARDRSGSFTMDWDFELGLWAHGKPPLDWGPVNPRWTGAVSIKFDRADRDGKVVGTAVAVRDAGGWHFSVQQ